jgi:hypothetical protein
MQSLDVYRATYAEQKCHMVNLMRDHVSVYTIQASSRFFR